MGATAMAMRRRLGDPHATAAHQAGPLSYADHARAIQELTVRYEKELSAARAGHTVQVDVSAEVQKALDDAGVEFEKLAATLTAENETLKAENAELKAHLDAATAPAPAAPAPADQATAPEGGSKKSGGRSGR